MNTAELRPIDARTMKPGDPVVRAGGERGRFIAYLPDADPEYQALLMFPTDGRATAYTTDGRVWRQNPPIVFLPHDPDPIDPSPGNVDKLRKSQVGEGWRIPAHDEKPDWRAHVWSMSGVWRTNCEPKMGRPYAPASTYRVPIAPIKTVPLAMEDFAGKPWPLVKYRSGDCAWSIVSVHRDGVSLGGAAAFTSWFSLRYSYELSHDHGVTWVKAEKEEQA